MNEGKLEDFSGWYFLVSSLRSHGDLSRPAVERFLTVGISSHLPWLPLRAASTGSAG